jgi:hypothetical protein
VTRPAAESRGVALAQGRLEQKKGRLTALLAAHHGLPPPDGAWPLSLLLSRAPLRARRADTFASVAGQLLGATPRQLAAGLSVRFAGEAAVDAGGCTRELFALLASQCVDERLVRTLEDGSLYLRPRSGEPAAASPPPLCWYEAVGRLVGCALAAACAPVVDGVTAPLTFPLSLSTALLRMATDTPIVAADVRATSPLCASSDPSSRAPGPARPACWSGDTGGSRLAAGSASS